MGRLVRYYVAVGEFKSPHSLGRIVSDDDSGLQAEVLRAEGWIVDETLFTPGPGWIISRERAREIASQCGLPFE